MVCHTVTGISVQPSQGSLRVFRCRAILLEVIFDDTCTKRDDLVHR
jgi:hypothetical protein